MAISRPKRMVKPEKRDSTLVTGINRTVLKKKKKYAFLCLFKGPLLFKPQKTGFGVLG
jgi:hypothetical protein